MDGRATLVSIHSQEENDFVESLFNYKNGLNAWIGGYSSPTNSKWHDGSVFDYSNWASDTERKPIGFMGIMMYGRAGSQPGKWINKDLNTRVTGLVCSHNLKKERVPSNAEFCDKDPGHTMCKYPVSVQRYRVILLL